MGDIKKWSKVDLVGGRSSWLILSYVNGTLALFRSRAFIRFSLDINSLNNFVLPSLRDGSVFQSPPIIRKSVTCFIVILLIS